MVRNDMKKGGLVLAENKFFKPTNLFKEYMILDMIEKDSSITQRIIAKAIDTSVSMVNDFLFVYQENGYITKTKHTNKNVEYFVTKKGIERRKVLNISYLNASQQLYNSAKENIENFLIQIEEKGFKKILLYGAGEVAEILLNAIRDSKVISITVLAVIDDDPNKMGHKLGLTDIVTRDFINHVEHDGILISSHTNNETIYNKLILDDYSKDKVIQFFDL